MARDDTDLVFGDLFSPGQLDGDGDRSELPIVLEMVKEHEGEPYEFDDAVAERFLADSKNPDARKGNLRYGLGVDSGYGLVDGEFYLTDIGEELYELRDNEDALYERFAQYILLECDGLKLVEIVDDMHATGEKPSLPRIRDAFEEQYGIYSDETTSDVSQMRGWLNKVGVIGTGRNYDVDWDAVEDLIGVDSDALLDLSELTNEQQAFAKALALIDPVTPVPNSIVGNIAENAYGVQIPKKSIVKDVLKPLQEAGYIEYKNPSDVSGKANLVIPTDKFENEVLVPLLDDVSERIGVPRHILRTKFEEVREQMDADSKHERGLALEVMAVKMGRLLGLEFEGWHVRGRNTGGTEVDVVMDSTDVSFSLDVLVVREVVVGYRLLHVLVNTVQPVEKPTRLFVRESGHTGFRELDLRRAPYRSPEHLTQCDCHPTDGYSADADDDRRRDGDPCEPEEAVEQQQSPGRENEGLSRPDGVCHGVDHSRLHEVTYQMSAPREHVTVTDEKRGIQSRRTPLTANHRRVSPL